MLAGQMTQGVVWLVRLQTYAAQCILVGRHLRHVHTSEQRVNHGLWRACVKRKWLTRGAIIKFNSAFVSFFCVYVPSVMHAH